MWAVLALCSVLKKSKFSSCVQGVTRLLGLLLSGFEGYDKRYMGAAKEGEDGR
jgi:hypothetical protein